MSHVIRRATELALDETTVTALRAAQLGVPVTLVEADRLGGTCLIRGCIPSKAMIHAAEKFTTVREAASMYFVS